MPETERPEGVPIRVHLPGHEPPPVVQLRVPAHLVVEAHEWAVQQFGKMSQSAAVGVALAQALPLLRRQADLRAQGLSGDLPDVMFHGSGKVLGEGSEDG